MKFGEAMEYVADGGEVYDKFHLDIVVCMIAGSLHVKNTKTGDAHPFVPNEVDIHRDWIKKEGEESKTDSDAVLDALARNMEARMIHEQTDLCFAKDEIVITIDIVKNMANKEDWDLISELIRRYKKSQKEERIKVNDRTATGGWY